MNLKKATLLIIIGLSVSFLLRAASTLHPEIFQSGTATRIISVLLFLSSIAVLVFFAYFFKGNLFPSRFQPVAKLIIAGSIGISLLKLKRVLLVFDEFITPELMQFLIRLQFLDLIIVWFNSLFLMIFFFTCFKEFQYLKKASVGALLGSSIGLVSITISMIMSRTTFLETLYSKFPTTMTHIALIISASGFMLLINFLFLFIGTASFLLMINEHKNLSSRKERSDDDSKQKQQYRFISTVLLSKGEKCPEKKMLQQLSGRALIVPNPYFQLFQRNLDSIVKSL